MAESVMREWVSELPFKMQTVLIMATRGCDAEPKRGASKAATRAMRSVILKNADNVTEFMRTDLPPFDMDGCEGLPLHWLTHTLHAAEIIGYFHPDMAVRGAWYAWYLDAVAKLHLRPETRADLINRLRGDNGPRLDIDFDEQGTQT